MKPYGKSHKLIVNHKDYHPDKDSINWWENNFSVVKKRERQKNKKIINEHLEEYNDKNES